MSQRLSVKKSYCKVCHDSGKSEKEYSSHWVKNADGKVICPTLLSTECRYCFTKGHTVKFCVILEKSRKVEPKMTAHANTKVEPKMTARTKPSVSRYSILEIAEEKDAPEQKFPVKTGWAAIAAKPKQEERKEDYLDTITNTTVLKKTKQFEIELMKNCRVLEPMAINKTKRYITSWADCSDSESEDEY